MVKHVEYPAWICYKCGCRLDNRINKTLSIVSTIHDGDVADINDRCGWCGSLESLTEPRDFGWPKYQTSLLLK